MMYNSNPSTLAYKPMNSIIFTYAPNLSKKYSQFTVVLHSAQRKGNKWDIDERGLVRHTGDLDYLANHAADRFRFKLALDSELEFRSLEARSLVDPNSYDLLRIHPNILAEFILRSQNQGVLTDNNGNVTNFKVFENIIPKLAVENDGLALYIREQNFHNKDFIIKFLPVTVVFKNTICQLRNTITYAFLNDIPVGKPLPEPQRESLLMQYINIPDKIRIQAHEKQKIVRNLKDKPILNFDAALRKAQLIFMYENIPVPDTDQRDVILDPDKHVEVHRNTDREDEYRAFLKKTGFFLRPKDKFNWFLSSKPLSAVYATLIQYGFTINVHHRILNPIPELKWHITSDKHHIYVGGKVLSGRSEYTPEHLFAAFQKNQGYFTSPDGSYGLISEEIKQLLKKLSANSTLDGECFKFFRSDFSFINAQFRDTEGVETDNAYEQLQAFAKKFDGIKRHPVPDTLTSILREYQVLGYNWLRTLRELGLNGILSDDMGLGKTLQILALIKSLKDEKTIHYPILLIVPKTLIFNWMAEIEKFTPDLAYIEFTGPDTLTDKSRLKSNPVVMTSYGMIRQHFDCFSEITWEYLILDEAQAIKNPSAKISKAVKELKSNHRLSITGTPVENSAMDLWSQFDFLMPGFLYSQKKFKRTYANGRERLEDVHLKTKPYILRRLKSQVAKELPEKTEMTLFCDFTKSQKTTYDNALTSARNTLDTADADNTINILQLILRLRQIACHPALVMEPRQKPVSSGKLDAIFDTGMEILSEGHKILMFSQFTEHLKLVEEAFARHSVISFYMDGKTRNREAVVRQFKAYDGPCPFFISLKTGGTGLNLSEANYVFLLDPWWNPAVENQAIDRSHRIGQENPVFVYRFITKNSIEEKVNELKAIKQKIEQTVIDASSPEYMDQEHVPINRETMKELISG